MRHYTEITIGEDRYTVSQFPATKGTKVLARLVRLIGEPMSYLLDQDGQASDVFPKAARALVDHLDENETMALVNDLLGSVTTGGAPIIFDTHFQGRIGHLFKLLKEVVQYQYEDFLDVVAGGNPVQTATASPSPSTSTGPSGGSSSVGSVRSRRSSGTGPSMT